MSTKAMKAAKARVAGDGMTNDFKDPLDAGGNDPEVVAQQLKEYKDTLVVKNDPSLGAEESEAAFQEVVSRYCEYLEPEYEDAIEKEHKRQMEEFDDDEQLERKWIPPDEFGQKGDFRNVGIAYSYEREKITAKIGVPGHPAPALQRWRDRKTLEAKRAHWTESELTMEQVLAADYDTEEAEEEAIIKLLSVKYQKIEELKKRITGAQANPDAKKAVSMAGERTRPAPLVGPKHSMWSVLRHKFPVAPLFYPSKVEEGDQVIASRGQKNVFAWQRTLARRRALAKKVQEDLAAASSDVPKHRFRQRLRKEDVDRCHEYIEQILSGNTDYRPPTTVSLISRAESAAAGDGSVASSQQRRGTTSAMKQSRAKSTASLGRRTGEAAVAEAEAAAAAREAKKQKKKERAERKALKDAKKRKKEEQKAKKEAEKARLEQIAEEEAEKKKRGFLPKILFKKKKHDDSDSDDDDEEEEWKRKEEEAEEMRAAEEDDGAGWARAYRASFPDMLTDGLRDECEELLELARLGEASFGTRLKKYKDERMEELTEEPVKFLTTKDFVDASVEGNYEKVAQCLIQDDPPLAVDAVDETSGTTPVFACLKTLMEVERGQEELAQQSKGGQVTKASRAASKLNGELAGSLEQAMALLVESGANLEIPESGDGSSRWTILAHASSIGSDKRVKNLLRRGVATDVLDTNERTPLMEAAMKGHLAVADALIRSGAALDLRDVNGYTALHLAAMFGRTAMCTALLLAGADKQARNKDLESPAEVAFRRGHSRTNQSISTFYRDRVPVKRILTELESDYLDGGRT